MHRSGQLNAGVRFFPILLVVLLARFDSHAQDNFGKLPQRDTSKPIATKAQIVNAWQKRQEAIKTFRFAWTEQQNHYIGWVPNPRFPEREWLDIPGLFRDRNFNVAKTLAVDADKMRYAYELDRKPEPDGVQLKSTTGDNIGLGPGSKYSYTSV